MTAVWMRTFALLGIVALVVGCGGEGGDTTTAGGLDETDTVRSLVSSLPDYAGRDAKVFNAFYADGSAPNASTRKKMKDYLFNMLDVSFSGDSATITVEVFGDSGKSEATWTAVKQDGEWKLKDAPLP